MKIGIITHHWGRDNYGQYLQHYAMQEFLRSQGHEPYLINFIPSTSLGKLFVKALLHPGKAITFLGKRLRGNTCPSNDIEGERSRSFGAFRNKHFAISPVSYRTIAHLRKMPPEADIYITGSDQVWNPFGFISAIPAFFLDFGSPEVKRIAYAASWGRRAIPPEEYAIVVPLLKKFDKVTVRENSGVKLCCQCGYEQASCAPDPTFLLTREQYRKISIAPISADEKYVLIYRVHNAGGDDFEYARLLQWAKARGLAIKYVTGNGLKDQYPKLYPSIEEWLGLIEGAEYIVTNSFHGTVFALIFQKRFGTISLCGKSKGMNARVDTLFESLGMDARYIQNNDFSILDQPYIADTAEVTAMARRILTDSVAG